MVLEPGVTLTESNGEVLFVSEESEQVFGVDGPAAEALVLLQRGQTLGEVIGALLDAYDVEGSVLERDVVGVLDEMVRRRVLRARADPRAG
jgi:hypothetical protein